jgi:hypothetical protein
MFFPLRALCVALAFVFTLTTGCTQDDPEVGTQRTAPTNNDDNSPGDDNTDPADDGPGDSDRPDDDTPDDNTPDDDTPDDDTPDDPDDTTDPDDPDAFGPDPDAVFELHSGDFDECVPGFLSGGKAAGYAGFAGSSDGAYALWTDDWDEPTTNLRVETWDRFGGPTGPGTYTFTPSDTNYANCAVCVFSEGADGAIYWPTPGDTIEFTGLATGAGGIGTTLDATFTGTLTNGECSGEASFTLRAVARDMDFGPF